ncbi:MAG TPA: dockerin type I domain-containing protein, partial [Verrucomicrobiae bacterium]|nr:dockerin type I domain-containing protein [Verrucomicrobiae bacterium]
GQSFTFTVGVPSGTKTISLKPRFYLRMKFAVSITGNQATLNMSGATFLGGDVNGDNQVEGTDYAWLQALWGRTSNPTYDINGDGVINAADFPDLNGDGSIDDPDYDILADGWYNAGDEE